MKLIATMPVRNEDWILGLSGRVALSWCDEVVFLNHASTDQTVDILAELQHEYPGRVHIISDPDMKWAEMTQRQAMLELARAKGATHIAIVDADEVLTGDLCISAPRAFVSDFVRDGAIMELPGYNLRCSTTRYHANGMWGRRWFSIAFKDHPSLSWNGDRFHHREPMGMALQKYRPIAQGNGGVMHLWGANDRRLRAKHALYKITERIRWPQKPIGEIDRMYSWAFTGMTPDESRNWIYNEVPAAWWSPYQQWMKHLHLYREPWHEAEARRLVMKYGIESFAGLDLFGVI